MPKNALNFKKPPLLNKQSILHFREHEGETIEEVMKYDASYLVFLVEKKLIDVDTETWDEICECEFEQGVNEEISGILKNVDWGLGDLPWLDD